MKFQQINKTENPFTRTLMCGAPDQNAVATIRVTPGPQAPIFFAGITISPPVIGRILDGEGQFRAEEIKEHLLSAATTLVNIAQSIDTSGVEDLVRPGDEKLITPPK